MDCTCAKRFARHLVFCAAQRHIVDIDAQPLVELTGERETGRVPDVAGEAGHYRDGPALVDAGRKQPSGRKGGIVQMG